MNVKSEINGHWGLPGEEKKIPGVLHLTPDGIKLNLIGLLISIKKQSETIEIIVGNTDYGYITLINSFAVSSNYPLNNLQVGSQTLLVNKCLIGNEYSKLEEIKFSKVAFRFQHNESWAENTGFKNILPKNNKRFSKFSINYKTPKTVRLFKNTDKELSLYYCVNQRFASSINPTATIQEKVYHNLHYKKPVHLQEILETIYSLKTLQTLSLSNRTKLCEVEFFSQRKGSYGITFYSSEILKPEENVEIWPFNMAMTFNKIQDNALEIYKNWFDNQENLAQVFELYYNSIYLEKRFGRTEFLNLAFALETFHRNVFGGEIIPQNEYKEILKTIESTLPIKIKEALITKMSYLYQFSFRNRLSELIKKFDYVFFNTNAKGRDFIGMIVNTRNYFVHNDISLKSKALPDNKLPATNNTLRLILECAILYLVGLPEQNIKLFAKKQSRHLFEY